MVQQAQNLWNLVIEQRKPACLPRFCCNWFLYAHDIDNDINPNIYLSIDYQCEKWWEKEKQGLQMWLDVANRHILIFILDQYLLVLLFVLPSYLLKINHTQEPRPRLC